MGTTDSKPQNTGASGDFSNADSNSITINETLENHSSTVIGILIIVAVILVTNLLIKLYVMNKKNIQRKERVESTYQVFDVRKKEKESAVVVKQRENKFIRNLNRSVIKCNKNFQYFLYFFELKTF